jgi:N-formylglutamate amidohydrolase
MKHLILHIPHASNIIPFKEGFVINDKKIQKEILKLTDWYTDELFQSKDDIKITAPFSRVFCDVERFSDDSQEEMFKFGMGVLYTKCDDNTLSRIIDPELRKRILDNYYWPHHQKLNKAVELRLKQENSCLIVDCHSFPEAPLIKAVNKNKNRPDFNVGTDNFHTPIEIIKKSENYFNDLGYTLGIDWPYSGSIVPMEYYKNDDRVKSIMLEVNRSLYLEGDTNNKSKDYNKTKEVVQGFLNLLRS